MKSTVNLEMNSPHKDGEMNQQAPHMEGEHSDGEDTDGSQESDASDDEYGEE